MMKLPSIALGTWSWGSGMAGGDQVFGNHTDAESLKSVFDAAYKAGLTMWDTATVYGMGASEDILGGFIKDYPRDNFIISTKFTPQIAPDTESPVLTMAEESCKRLHTDYIDIYWIHNPADVERWTPGLIALLKSGIVKRVGVSNHNLEQIKRADEILRGAGFRVSAVQNHFSLLYRSSEKAGILDYCKENDIDFFAYMTLEQGALSGKYGTANPMPEGSGRAMTYNPILPKLDALINEMKKIGEAHNASVSQIAIAYAINKGTYPIIGVTKPRHVEEAATATKIKLSKEEIETLESLAAATGVDTKGSWENPMA
ncbi:MAG: aldo/keto reductase [Muribaculaceae bacterium]|nr:aldo/keto reductase [Muribaculaceae bacterium]